MRHALVSLLLLTGCPLLGHEEPAKPARACGDVDQRGVWMYRHPGHPLGTDAIVGVDADEDAAIAQLGADRVTRVYGNYGDRPRDDAGAIAAWNAKLAAAGIESQLLLGDGDDIFPGCLDELLVDIDERLIDFHAGTSSPDERFTAVHLDIEPQQYKQSTAFPETTSCGLRLPEWMFWDTLTPAEKGERYELLLAAFAQVRAHLDGHGAAGIPLYVDLAPWIDSSTSLAWTDTPDIADGTDWLVQAATHVDGMTFMTYERDTAALIESSVAVELTVGTEVRVSVSAKERPPYSDTGSPLTWPALTDLWAVVEDIEVDQCDERPVDLFTYRYLLE